MVTVPRPTGDALTIDELARRVGMTVRNIRAHQSRGLLPPPEVRGRTGFYGPAHVARLELIKDMQGEGYNLRAIEHALSRIPPGSDEQVLSFRRALIEPWANERPEIVTAESLADIVGTDDPALIAQAVKLGLLCPLDADRYEVPSPTLLRAGAEVIALGVPPRALLEVHRQLQRHADGVARTFVQLFVEHVWRPFVDAGQPEDRFPDIREALDRLQPLASQSLLAMFGLSMDRHVEHAMSVEFTGDPKRRPRRKD